MHISPSSIAVLLKSHISRQTFQELAALVSQKSFVEMYLPFTEGVAARLSEIPLRKDSYSQRGGALACSVAAGFLAVKLCSQTIFDPGATAAKRMEGDVQYRWLAYCASMATVYLIATNSVQVQFEEGEIYSFASADTLTDLKSPFTVYWSNGTLLPIQHLYMQLQELFWSGQFEGLSPRMLSEFGLAINPTLQAPSNESPLGKVVRQAVSKVIDDDKARVAQQVRTDDSIDEPKTLSTPAAPSAVVASTPAQGPIEPTVPSAPTKPVKSDGDIEQQPVVAKAQEWLRGLAAMKALHAEIKLLDNGHMSITRKALSFGAAARDNYQMLYDAKLVFEKVEGGVVCTKAARDVFESNLASEPAGVKE